MSAKTNDKSTYMHDSMVSVLNEQQGIELYNQLSILLSKAGMQRCAQRQLLDRLRE